MLPMQVTMKEIFILIRQNKSCIPVQIEKFGKIVILVGVQQVPTTISNWKLNYFVFMDLELIALKQIHTIINLHQTTLFFLSMKTWYDVQITV